jgi:hypothetical protein
MRKFLPPQTFMFFSSVLLCCLAALSIFYLVRQTSTYRDDIIAEDIAQLSAIFKTIHNTCGISSFEHERKYIDFLTIKTFVGSEVGSMNLSNPAGWQGPYLNDNPTVQQKYYEIVRTRKGYFIVPGQGVTLANGQVVGKDIIVNQSADVLKLVQDGILKSKDRPLAALIDVGSESRVILAEES